MFEEKTSQVIHEEMLNDISNEFDKTVGSFIYDVTKPAADQFEEAYKAMDGVVELFDVDNLTGTELAAFIRQRTGIVRRAATFAIGVVTVEGNGTVTEGDLFQTTSGIQFEATETVTISATGTVEVKAVVSGSTGNVPANQIVEMPISIEGINTVTNLLPTTNGFDAEADDVLRARYYERLQTPATSGNKYHYYNWAKEVPGVGDAKVFPLWAGDNTVKVVIIDANAEPASPELVETVQTYIDPDSNGLGEGVAPIGAYTTVVSATALTINLQLSVTPMDGYTTEQIEDEITESVTAYLRAIAFKQDFVSYAQIGNAIIDSPGVLDYANLQVNGGTANIVVADDAVAVLGGVTLV